MAQKEQKGMREQKKAPQTKVKETAKGDKDKIGSMTTGRTASKPSEPTKR